MHCYFPLTTENWNTTVKKIQLLRFYHRSLLQEALMRFRVCMCVCQDSSSITFHRIFWDRLSQLNPELTDLTSLAASRSQRPFSVSLALGIIPVQDCKCGLSHVAFIRVSRLWPQFSCLIGSTLAPKCFSLGDTLSVYLTQVHPDICFKTKIAFPTVFPQNRCLNFHFHTEHVGIGLLHSHTMPVCIRWNPRAYFPKQWPRWHSSLFTTCNQGTQYSKGCFQLIFQFW